MTAPFVGGKTERLPGQSVEVRITDENVKHVVASERLDDEDLTADIVIVVKGDNDVLRSHAQTHLADPRGWFAALPQEAQGEVLMPGDELIIG